jgi:3-deoxy-D-manno-octulosonic-acid transferase
MEAKPVAVLIYNVIILLTLPVAIAYLAVQLLIHKKYRESVLPRLGFLSHVIKEDPGRKPVFWIHAVSVGEVMAVTPLVRRLREVYPRGRLLVSTVTQTGQATARQKLPEADLVFYFPFDLPWVVRKVIQRIRPTIFVFLETEIWPNFLFALARAGVPAVMVNGRISEKSYRGYRLLGMFFRKVLEAVSLFSVQTDLDKERLIALGVDAQRVVKTGNMKYDQAVGPVSESPKEIRRVLKLPSPCDLIIAGSTHSGEEEMLASCYRRLSQTYPQVRLLLAPRHLERLEKIEEMLRHQKLKPVRKTKMESSEFSSISADTVILLDTLGELQQLYGAADLVFVGGSLVPIGGHNVLEPAALAKPVLFGPYTQNCYEIAQLLLDRGAACRVRNEDHLYDQICFLLDHPEQSAKMGIQAKEVVFEQQGIVEKNLALLRGLL